MVDSALVAAKIAAVGDATARVRAVLPPTAEAFVADRTVREVVTLNLFVAIQACLDLGDLDAFCATLARRISAGA